MNRIPTNNKKALIIGSGIGGPTAAMALQRGGIEPVVHEAYDAPSDYAGLFLNTASNGLDVLRTLGIDVLVRADCFPMPRMVMWSHRASARLAYNLSRSASSWPVTRSPGADGVNRMPE